MRTLFFVISVSVLALPYAAADEDAANQLQFNRDIRPLLSDRCFLCHGPDQSSEQASETELRLDDRQSAVDFAVFDFDEAEQSDLIARITSNDPDLMMPPPESGKKALTPDAVETLTRWIRQGAPYEQHWAYLPPQRPQVPTFDSEVGITNAIDAFVLRQLQQRGMTPAPLADRATLIRRVTFDLTGLPPTIAEIEAFVQDPSDLETAFEKVVDRLLKSPRYGEQMARFWLDASRYADTSGYQYDRERKQWVWRDWVIHAFNSNLPFDQFTIQQIAGDLLPDATDQTRLATGFNRNHPITIEGGVVDEEYRTEYVIDRVVTTSTVWLGQTFICARCHDHKYDPVSQEDFYQFYSFFNNVPERGLNGFDPKLKVISPLDTKVQALQLKVAEAEAGIADLQLPYQKWEQQLRDELPSWDAVVPESVESTGGSSSEVLDDKSVLMSGTNPPTDDYLIQFTLAQPVQAIKLEAITHPSLTSGSASRGSNGNFVLSEFVIETQSGPAGEFQAVKVVKAWADYEQKGYPIGRTIDGKVDRNGWAVDGNTKPENRTATFELEEAVPAGTTLRLTMRHRYGASHQIGRFRISFSEHPSVDSKTEQLLAISADRRSGEQANSLKQLLMEKFGDAISREKGEQLKKLRDELVKASDYPLTMVMREMPKPRQAYVLGRGEYDKPLKDRPVQPAVPAAMGTLPESASRDRLGLAQWLVAKDQPLTARVTVNRFWQRLFGVGLVKTSEDFGSQGEYPSHPELLDWLAIEFMERGWDVKRILKTIVMSRTYRQSSHLTPEALARDPENRLLARGPRRRLDGEEIRDGALAVSGLLDTKIGGPSVYPYHPRGLWLEINNRPNYSRAYPHQTDPQQHYRRTLYTFWKRTVPPPSVATFDAPGREYCVVRRSSTNTPLQAFVMLHDPQFVEAARHLAMRMLKEGGSDLDARITFAFQCGTSRKPEERERAILRQTYHDRVRQFRSDPKAADQLLSVGLSPIDDQYDRAELAALTQVARMIMNLSEFLTKG